VAVAGGRASIEHRRTGLAASGPLLALGILFVAMVGCHRFVYFVATFPFSVLVIGWPLCTPLDIRNESGEALRVTPLGKRELSEKREPLPIEHLCVPPVFARQVGDLPLAPGGELRLSYDGDNVCVSDLVVRDARGDLWLMAGSRFQHDFVIRDPRTLPPLDPGLHDAFEQALRPAPHGWSAGPLRTMRALNPLLFVVAMAAFAAAFRLRRPRPLAEAPSAPGTHLAAPPPDR
jgi:hypothetical protein